MDPNIILVNVLATIGVVKAILWLLEEENGEYKAPQDNKKSDKIKPLRISKRILGMIHDEDDEEEDKEDKDKTEKEPTAVQRTRRAPRWIRIIQEESSKDSGAERAPRSPEDEVRGSRSSQSEETDEVSEVYLYAICICVSIILSIIILR